MSVGQTKMSGQPKELFTVDLHYMDAFYGIPCMRKQEPHSVILLNHAWPEWFAAVLPGAVHILVADGGANTVLEHRDAFPAQLLANVALIGDFDSILPDARRLFADSGSTVTHMSGQDNTDCMKCLSALRARRPGARSHTLVLGAIGGRLDHTFAQIAALTLFRDLNPHMHGEDNVCFLIPPGRSCVVYINPAIVTSIGLLPIHGPTNVSTTGLMWNLSFSQPMDYATGFVSTSNALTSDTVTIVCDKDVLFIVCLRPVLASARSDAVNSE